MEFKLNRVFIGISVVIIILAVAVIVVSPPETYLNGEYGFSINPPKGWKIKENVHIDNITLIVAFIGPVENNFAVNINIYSENVKGMDLQEYVASNKKGLASSFPGYNLILEKNTTINSLEAYELIYTAKLRNKDLKYKQVFLIKDDEGYIITFAALKDNFDKYIAVFEKSIGTFRFL